MSIDQMDEYTVNLADAYAKDAYQKGYEQGVEDSKGKQPLGATEPFKGHCLHCFEEGYGQGKKDAVKHGHWIRHLAIGWSEAHYTCSCCGYYLHFDRRENANYCPKCGARLDEDEQYYKY